MKGDQAGIRTTLERRKRASPRVPEGYDLHLLTRGHAIVQRVADAREVNATYTPEPGTCGRCATRWLVSDEGKRGGKIVAQGIRCPRAVDPPPLGGSFYLTRRAVREHDRQRTFSGRVGGAVRRPR